MSACCAARRPASGVSVQDCLERGMETRRLSPLPLRGQTVQAASGLHAGFSAAVLDGRLKTLQFECSACATLVAYCQAMVDMLVNQPINSPAVPALDTLIARVSGVPPLLQDRAAIALGSCRALMMTIQTNHQGG